MAVTGHFLMSVDIQPGEALAELVRSPLRGRGHTRPIRGARWFGAGATRAPLYRAKVRRSRDCSAPDGGWAVLPNGIVAATMSSGARRCGNDVVGTRPVVSPSGLYNPASPSDYMFSAASIVNWRTGWIAQLPRPGPQGRGHTHLIRGAHPRCSRQKGSRRGRGVREMSSRAFSAYLSNSPNARGGGMMIDAAGRGMCGASVERLRYCDRRNTNVTTHLEGRGAASAPRSRRCGPAADGVLLTSPARKRTKGSSPAPLALVNHRICNREVEIIGIG
jgi:hypothetical protein